jgi:hypothetical protein
VSEKKILYGVRLRRDQVEFLRKLENPSEWIREAIDEKRRREKRKIKPSTRAQL